MRRIMVPYKLLSWIEVDLDSGEVVDVRASDYHENYESWPNDTDPIKDENNNAYARGLVNLEDFPDRDLATDEESVAAGRIIENPDKTWPKLWIDDSMR